MKSIFNRLREPSSMAGMATLAILFGVPTGAAELIVQVVGGIAGLAAILLPEKRGD